MWVLVVGAAALWSYRSTRVPPGEVGSFLPQDAPHLQSSRLIQDVFPDIWANSTLVVVAHREGGLAPADFEWLGWLAGASHSATGGKTLSPTVPFLRNRLVSGDSQAAMVVVNLPTNFISEGTIKAVDDVAELITKGNRPGGLVVEITGTAGIGHDYFDATQAAAHRTTWVTVIAVLVILIIVYRSPIGALVPLISIGASVFVAFMAFKLLSFFGWEVSAMERIFCVVLMFGAGVDYALFWIARYREALADDPAEDCSAAAVIATRFSGPAILASGATTICGMSTMLVARLEPSQNAGRILAVALFVALMAALTLAPALSRALGRWLFWPFGSRGGLGFGQTRVWPRVANVVMAHPGRVLVIGTLLLAAPALYATRIEPRFDALSELPPGTSSSRGLDLANANFSKGQLYSNTILAVYPSAEAAPSDLRAVSASVCTAIRSRPGIIDVYSLDAPLGQASGQNALLGPLLNPLTRTFYQGQAKDGRVVLRFEILTDYMPFTPEAIASFEGLAQISAQQTAATARAGQAPKIMLSGPTSYIIGVKSVVGPDQRNVMVLSTLIIGVIVLAMVRDLPLTLFMLLATWLTYGATLTLSTWFFIHAMGLNGLDWKVRMILFVIVVAVGQDYNIFLVSRLLHNRRKPRDAARDAIVRTGSVISSCGIIMAATLGSLWAGRLSLLEQLGFALGLGILIDTFFVRPLLIPGFFLLLHGRPAAEPVTAPEPEPAATEV
jgi:putative drug exporter of the RND superfamily